MSHTQNFGVNLSTGKLSLPMTLGTLTGPNNFGSTISLNYATSGLLSTVTTWNEEAPTSTVGLGWSLQAASTIVRSGSGSWQDSFFLLIGDQTMPLLLRESPLVNGKFDTLTFVTQSKSLYNITYDVPSETWSLIDQDGNTCTYGGLGTNAVDLGVRWISQTGGQPAVWVGVSTESTGQQNYAVAWRLTQKMTPSGQKVHYTWSQVQQSVGKGASDGLLYTMANYLTGIQVENGSSVVLNYEDKLANEYPSYRWKAAQPTSVAINPRTNENAFQDRIETKYLDNLIFYDVNHNVQDQVVLTYDFLYDHFPSGQLNSDEVSQMNKRLLVGIQTLTANGIQVAPPQQFDYWGLFDAQLQKQIFNTKLLRLNDHDVSIANITDYIGAKDGRTYNALFGHLKTIQSSQGGLLWYSYGDNSKVGGWDLRYDMPSDISLPDSPYDNIVWSSPQPYWGEDNYVVIRWNGIGSSKKYIAFKIYEWIGKWIPITIHQPNNPNPSSYLIQPVYDFADESGNDYYTYLSMGSGKFSAAYTNISIPENLSIFHRDAHTPGVWNVSYFSMPTCQQDGTNNILPITYKDTKNNNKSIDSLSCFQLNMGIGNNIVSVLDVISGKLNLFSLQNNQWVQEPAKKITSPASSIPFNKFVNTEYDYPSAYSTACVVGDDVFVIYGGHAQSQSNTPPDQNSTLSYFLYHYDKTASGASRWSFINKVWYDSNNQPVKIVGGLNKGNYNTYIYGLESSVADGFILVQPILNYGPSTAGLTLMARPIVVTWDDTYQSVNFQQIFSPNNAKKYALNNTNKMVWGYTLEETKSFDPDNFTGSIACSNLINLITAAEDNQPCKYIMRYRGGTDVADTRGTPSENIGWYCYSSAKESLQDGSDSWVKMATYDTDIFIHNAENKTYTYELYQLQPYLKDGQYWIGQEGVGMGQNKDWQDIERIVRETLFFTALSLRLVALTLSFGSSFVADVAIKKTLGCLKKVIHLAAFTINNPLVHQIGRCFFESALSTRRMGDGYGQNYMITGQSKQVTSGAYAGSYPYSQKPTVYYKKWDTEKTEWIWSFADHYNLLNSIQVPVISFKDPKLKSSASDLQIVHSLSSDVYRYGSSFSLFSYTSFLERDLGKHDHDNVVRNFYADQVVFFRNGILSDLVPMPNFSTNDPKYINKEYGTLQLPYTFYQSSRLPTKSDTTSFVDGGTNNFTMYAPWGGILAYQPQVYTNYDEDGMAKGVQSDMIFESLTRDKSDTWDSNQHKKIFELPAAPNLQYAVSMRLFMAQNQMVSGLVSDFAVDKIAIDDGIQVKDTHLCYISDNATYQEGLNSVVYNQVRVSSGATTYQSAIQKNGWTEYYFYSGSSPALNAKSFPYDPATDESNPFYEKSSGYTNASTRLNDLLGQGYAVRAVKYKNSTALSGIEMSREYIYSYAFNQTVGAQLVQGIVSPLTLSFVAADNAAQTLIQESTYTSSAQYSFYDVTGLNGTSTLSSLETGMTLAQQTTSNHLTSNGVQTQNQVTSYTYGFQTEEYGDTFRGLNLYSPVVTTITSQTPETDAAELVICQSTATVWATATNSADKSYWYPLATYNWCGSKDGNLSPTIPWTANTPNALTAGDDWQLTSYTASVKNGIVGSSVAVTGAVDEDFQGVRTVTLYDKTRSLPVGVFSSANLVQSTKTSIPDDMFLFTTFEDYEDLSSWHAYDQSTQRPLDSLPITQDTCYVGKQSIKLVYGQGVYFETSTNGYPADRMVLSFFYRPSLLGVEKDKINLSICASQDEELRGLKQLSYTPQCENSPWSYQQVVLDLKTIAQQVGIQGPFGLHIEFTWEGEGSPCGYLDGVSLVPLGGSLTGTIYDSVTRLPIATLDENGLTSRTIYDDRYNVIGTTLGKLETETLQSLSLTGYAEESLTPANAMNTQMTLTAQGGGTYYDFRTEGDLMGWAGEATVSNQQLILQGKQSVTQAFDMPKTGNNDFGIRLQISPSSSLIGLVVTLAEVGKGGAIINIIALQSGSNIQFTAAGSISPQPVTVPLNTQQNSKDWFLFTCQGVFYFYVNGQPIFQEIYASSISNKCVTLRADSNPVTLDHIMIIQGPSIVTSFLDGTQKTRQVQSTAEIKYPSYQDSAILISEKLYDLQGRNAFNSITTSKSGGTFFPKIAFEDAFINNRNPATAQSNDFWTGGVMTGLITRWVDQSFSTGQDPSYAYSGSYYESDPTNRLDKTNVPGAIFKASSTYASTFCYGQYETLPNSTDLSKIITPLLNTLLRGLSTAQIENLYQNRISQIALNSTSVLTLLTVTEASGQAVASLTLDPNNASLLKTTTYQIGQKMGRNGQPIIRQNQVQLPKYYDTSGNLSPAQRENYQIKTETSFLGKTTYVHSADGGDRVCYYDNAALLRFTQNADQAAAGICLSYIYDDQQRLIGVNGITLTKWDITTLEAYLSGAQTPTTTTAIQAYIYDILSQSVTNSQSRLVQIESWNSATDLKINDESYVREVLCYNDFGQVSHLEITNGTQDSFIIQCTYTPLGQLENLTYPALFGEQETVNGVVYTYNTQGKVAAIGRLNADQSIDATYYAQYRYDTNGNIIEEDLVSISFTRTYQYNVLGLLTRFSDNKNYFIASFDYSATGNYQYKYIKSKIYEFGDGSGSSTLYATSKRNYDYDAFGRLTEVGDWKVDSDYSQGYDANGNLYGVKKQISPITYTSQSSFITYTYNAGTNQIKTRSDSQNAYTYTPSGFLNSNNMVHSVLVPRPMQCGTTKMAYNSRGERTRKETDDMVIQYRRQGGQVLQETVHYKNSKNTYLLSYIYGPTGLIATEITQMSGTNKGYDGTYFMIKDELGSIRVVYNSANKTSSIVAYIDYSAWGELIKDNNPMGIGGQEDDTIASLFRYLYTGQEWDADMGYYNYHARQYDPSMGRFLSPDPKHQFSSPYLYCANNPVNATDPDGRGIVFRLVNGSYQVVPFFDGKNPILVLYDSNDSTTRKLYKAVERGYNELTDKVGVCYISYQDFFSTDLTELPALLKLNRPIDLHQLAHGIGDEKLITISSLKLFAGAPHGGNTYYTPEVLAEALQNRLGGQWKNLQNNIFYACQTGNMKVGHNFNQDFFNAVNVREGRLITSTAPNGSFMISGTHLQGVTERVDNPENPQGGFAYWDKEGQAIDPPTDRAYVEDPSGECCILM